MLYRGHDLNSQCSDILNIFSERAKLLNHLPKILSRLRRLGLYADKVGCRSLSLVNGLLHYLNDPSLNPRISDPYQSVLRNLIRYPEGTRMKAVFLYFLYHISL